MAPVAGANAAAMAGYDGDDAVEAALSVDRASRRVAGDVLAAVGR